MGNNIFHKIHIEIVPIREKSGNETVKYCLQSLLRYRTEGFIPNPLPLPDYAEICANRKPYSYINISITNPDIDLIERFICFRFTYCVLSAEGHYEPTSSSVFHFERFDHKKGSDEDPKLAACSKICMGGL